MRILSFSYCFPNKYKPTWGIFVAQRLKALSQRPNIELEVCAPVPRFPVITSSFQKIPPKIENTFGLLVHHPRFFYIPRYLKHLDAYFYAKGLYSWLKNYHNKKKPSILDAHFGWPDGVGVYYLAKKFKIPYIITQRGWLWVGMKIPKMWQQAKKALKNASAVINLCQSMANICLDIGCEEKRVFVIPNGIDKSRFYPIDKKLARKKLDLPLDIPIVICVAYFQRRKGILELVQAFTRLPKESLLILIGAPAEKNYFLEVQNAIDKLQIRNRVLMPGPQPHETIPVYFNASDVTVLPSYWEGSPNVVVESLGCGTPVVATPVGSVPEQIIDGVNGYIVQMKDASALAEAIEKTLYKNWNRTKISATVSSWEDVAIEIEQVFHQVLEQV